MLTLPIKKVWFDMIATGEKLEEYRDISDYYNSRFKSGETKEIFLRNGYSRFSPTIKVLVKISQGYGKEIWGAIPNKKYWILTILKIIKEE